MSDPDARRIKVYVRMQVVCTECYEGVAHDVPADELPAYRFECPTHGELVGVVDEIDEAGFGGLSKRSRQRRLKRYGSIRRTIHASPRLPG